MTKHTPGPWTPNGNTRPVREFDHWCGSVYPNGSYRGEICSIQSADHIDGISREEAAANARLIAAAPELLFALRLILPLAKGYVAAHDVGGNRGKIEAAEEAIAKAEAV